MHTSREKDGQREQKKKSLKFVLSYLKIWILSSAAYKQAYVSPVLEREKKRKKINILHLGPFSFFTGQFLDLATWWEELTPWKRSWCWERLKAGGEGDDRGWDGWMASPMRWMWVWVSSRSWWWTGRPGVLRSMGSQRVGHDSVTELNWTSWKACLCCLHFLTTTLTYSLQIGLLPLFQ